MNGWIVGEIWGQFKFEIRPSNHSGLLKPQFLIRFRQQDLAVS